MQTASPVCANTLIGEGNDLIIYILIEFGTRYVQGFAGPAVKFITKTLRLNDSLAVSISEHITTLSIIGITLSIIGIMLSILGITLFLYVFLY